MIYNANRGKNSPKKTGKQLIPLLIDRTGEEKKPLTIEQHNEAVKKLNRFFKN
jgi:hypothetical protein